MTHIKHKFNFIKKIIQEKPIETYSNKNKFFFDCSVEVRCLECHYLMECEQLFEDDVPHLNKKYAEMIKDDNPEMFI